MSIHARVPMINNSIFVRRIIVFVHAGNSICDYLDSYLRACYQDAWVICMLAGMGGRFRAVVKAMYRQSVFVRIAEQLLGSLAERAKAVLVISYEGSRMLSVLERALANSKLIRFNTGDKTI